MMQHGRIRNKVFVGGPIHHALMSGTFSPAIRNLIEEVLAQISATGAEVLSAHVAEEFGRRTAALDADSIVRRDFAWMQDCDLFVAVLVMDETGALLRTDGTHVELGWASALKKPVLVLISDHNRPELTHLVRGLGQVSEVRMCDLAVVQEQQGVLAREVMEMIAGGSRCNQRTR